ncbi:hypothetical protein ACFE35_01035 [Phormidesmis priestleyi ANT.L61.2]
MFLQGRSQTTVKIARITYQGTGLGKLEASQFVDRSAFPVVIHAFDVTRYFFTIDVNWGDA